MFSIKTIVKTILIEKYKPKKNRSFFNERFIKISTLTEPQPQPNSQPNPQFKEANLSSKIFILLKASDSFFRSIVKTCSGAPATNFSF